MPNPAQVIQEAASELRRVMGDHPYLSHVQVYETASDIPEDSARALKQQGIDPERIQVAYGDDSDSAFLVVDKLEQGAGDYGHLAPLQDGLRTIAKEAVSQHGIKAVLGEHHEAVMHDIYATYPASDPAWQTTTEQNQDIPTATDDGKVKFTEKLIALMPDDDVVGGDIAMLKAEMLAALTVDLSGITANPDDLEEMLERHREMEGVGDPMLRRADFQAWFAESRVTNDQMEPLALYVHENGVSSGITGATLSSEPGNDGVAGQKAYASIQNPAPPYIATQAFIEMASKGFESPAAEMDAAHAWLARLGFDGAINQKPMVMTENERVRYRNGDSFNFISNTGEAMTVTEKSEPDPAAYTTGFVSPVTTLYNEAGEQVEQFDGIDDFLKAHSTMSVMAFDASQVKTINNTQGVVFAPEDKVEAAQSVERDAPDMPRQPEPWGVSPSM